MHLRNIIAACGLLIGVVLILAGAGPFFSMRVDPGPPRVSATISDCQQTSIALWAYKADHGAYPRGTASDMFRALSGDNPQRKAYLEKGSIEADEAGFPIDAWNHRIEISAGPDGRATVASPGKDGIYKKGRQSDDIEL
jgi:hypothetical protein